MLEAGAVDGGRREKGLSRLEGEEAGSVVFRASTLTAVARSDCVHT